MLLGDLDTLVGKYFIKKRKYTDRRNFHQVSTHDKRTLNSYRLLLAENNEPSTLRPLQYIAQIDMLSNQ